MNIDFLNFSLLYFLGKDFYEFAKGKQLSQSCFIRYYKELLPSNGDCDEFCKLLFNGNIIRIC